MYMRIMAKVIALQKERTAVQLEAKDDLKFNNNTTEQTPKICEY